MNKNFKIAAATYVVGFGSLIAASFIGSGVVGGLIAVAFSMGAPTIAFLVRGIEQAEGN